MAGKFIFQVIFDIMIGEYFFLENPVNFGALEVLWFAMYLLSRGFKSNLAFLAQKIIQTKARLYSMTSLLKLTLFTQKIEVFL